jgi:hypothetical protein
LQNISREVCRSIKLGKYSSFSRIVPVLYSIGWIYGVYLGKGSMHIHWYLRESWLYEKNCGTFFLRTTCLSIATKVFAFHGRNHVHAKFCSKHAYPLRWTVNLMTIGLTKYLDQPCFLLSSIWYLSLVLPCQNSLKSFVFKNDLNMCFMKDNVHGSRPVKLQSMVYT